MIPMSILNKEKILAQAKKLITQGKFDAAIKEYDKVLAVDPSDMRVKIRIAELYAKQKRIGDAIKFYRQVAQEYEKDGFYLKAVTVYKSVLRLNPSLIEINRFLAEIYEKMGLHKDAVHQYQILANHFEHKGESKNALDIRKRLVELDPAEATLRLRLAELYQWEGQEQESLDEYERVAQQYKDDGRVEQAIDLYEKILSHRPNNIEMIRELVLIYRKRGELKKAVKYLESNPKIFDNDPYLINILAEMYSRLNQVESAKNKYRELADLYLSRSEMDSALEAYKQVLVLDPTAEKDIEVLVESIRPGAIESLKEAATKRREQLEDQEKRRQELERRRQTMTGKVPQAKEISIQKSEVVETVAHLSKTELDDLFRKGKTAFDLGRLYFKTGLVVEGKGELLKAMELFNEIASNDISYSNVEKYIKETELLIEQTDKPSQEKEAKEAADEERSLLKSEDKKTQEKEEKKDAAKREEKDPAKKSKRISFV